MDLMEPMVMRCSAVCPLLRRTVVRVARRTPSRRAQARPASLAEGLGWAGAKIVSLPAQFAGAWASLVWLAMEGVPVEAGFAAAAWVPQGAGVSAAS